MRKPRAWVPSGALILAAAPSTGTGVAGSHSAPPSPSTRGGQQITVSGLPDGWDAKAPMPTARTILAAGVVNVVLYAVGAPPMAAAS
jgi:hypothetical protein